MPETPAPVSPPENGAERRPGLPTVEDLIPIMGEANARECLEVPITEAQRREIAAIVANAPRRLA